MDKHRRMGFSSLSLLTASFVALWPRFARQVALSGASQTRPRVHALGDHAHKLTFFLLANIAAAARSIPGTKMPTLLQIRRKARPLYPPALGVWWTGRGETKGKGRGLSEHACQADAPTRRCSGGMSAHRQSDAAAILLPLCESDKCLQRVQ